MPYRNPNLESFSIILENEKLRKKKKTRKVGTHNVPSFTQNYYYGDVMVMAKFVVHGMI